MMEANTIAIGMLPSLMSCHSSTLGVDKSNSFSAMMMPTPIPTEPTIAQPKVMRYAVKMLMPIMSPNSGTDYSLESSF
jgi:hypothetical protein